MVIDNDILNQEKSISIDITERGGTLLIIFGGIAGNMGMPPFEFSRLLGSLSCNKIFIRDVKQSWYQNGLLSICDSFDGMVEYLQNEILQIQPEKVVMLGNSAGAYASILAGNLMHVDEILAFSPQTFLSRFLRLRYADFRWRKQIGSLYKNVKVNSSNLDLKTALHGKISYKTKTKVFYCENHRLDRIHSERLKTFSNISLVAYPIGGHELVKCLKDTGELESIIKKAIIP